MIFQLSQEKMKIASQCFFKFRAAWVSWVNNNHKTKKRGNFATFGDFLNVMGNFSMLTLRLCAHTHSTMEADGIIFGRMNFMYVVQGVRERKLCYCILCEIIFANIFLSKRVILSLIAASCMLKIFWIVVQRNFSSRFSSSLNLFWRLWKCFFFDENSKLFLNCVKVTSVTVHVNCRFMIFEKRICLIILDEYFEMGKNK